MFAIVCNADGFPVSRRISNDAPDLVVTWTSQDAAKKFLAAKGIESDYQAKGIESDYQVIALTDDSLSRMAKALGCEPDAIAFDAYPA
jgi:hypothetical protein